MWSVVRVPSVEDEDNRHLHRELIALKRERTRHLNRIQGLLVAVGVFLRLRLRKLQEQLEKVRLWDGSHLPPALHCRILREYERLQCLQHQIVELQGDRTECLRECTSPAVAKARKLIALRGIGANGAWLLSMELFAWRELRNRRQVGALSGLTSTPHDSGKQDREQGISKAGNRPGSFVDSMRYRVDMSFALLSRQPEDLVLKFGVANRNALFAPPKIGDRLDQELGEGVEQRLAGGRKGVGGRVREEGCRKGASRLDKLALRREGEGKGARRLDKLSFS